jgi:hypothetical protein
MYIFDFVVINYVHTELRLRASDLHIFELAGHTVIQNCGFSLPKHSRRQLLRTTYSSKILPEASGFWTETSGFRTETSGFRTETSGFLNRNFVFRFWKPEFRVFKPKLFVLQRIFFVLPKIWVMIPGFFATATLEYQIHKKFLTKFRLIKNRRNSQSFERK